MRKILEHSVVNLLGQAIPMLIGLLIVPLLIQRMGTELFGTLTIIWVFVGYFSLFDLGLGRAVTRLTVEYLEVNNHPKASFAFWLAIKWMGIISLLVSVLIYWMAPWIATRVFKLSVAVQDDVAQAIQILACSIPLVAWQGALRGFLEANFKFNVLNLVQAINGIYTFGSPLVAWYMSPSLSTIVVFILVGRLLNVGFLVGYIYKHWNWLFASKTISEKNLSRRILRLGGWLTVSNVIGPVMVYFDRFLLSSFAPMGQVAYYTTPYEFVSRLSILPSSLVRVLFPTFSQPSQQKHIKELYGASLSILSAILAMPCLLLILFAKDGLNVWLGTEFALASGLILQILTLGVFFNSLALIPFTLIQSLEKVDWTAKLHLVELPFYLIFLWYSINKFGLKGAAIAWSLRMFVDEIILAYLASKAVRKSLEPWRVMTVNYTLGGAIFAAGYFVEDIKIKIGIAVLLILGCIGFLWVMRRNFIANKEDK